MTYAIVKTGGKQYRVEQGLSLLVERLPADDGANVELEPLLYVDGDMMLDGGELSNVTIEARILAHERGPKLRIVKFKPKRGYKRRNGHRQELTRIEVTGITLAAGRSRAAASAPEETPASGTVQDAPASGVAQDAPASGVAQDAPASGAVQDAPASTPTPVAAEPTDTSSKEAGNGA